jgi:O-acetyl-ADP-ribose deacetylase (regulator of RNase III)
MVAPISLSVVRGDITQLDVDAIVNAANTGLLGGGGVDGAIHRAAGPELLAACRALPEVRPGVRCPTGEARITPGFRLKARHVIHAVGPIWRGGGKKERELLASCYRMSMALARDHQVQAIAFPAISCGVYGFPIDEAAEIAVREIRVALDASPLPSQVQLVAFGDDVYSALSRATGS